MGKVCLDLKVDLERIVFFQIRKLQIVAATSTTIIPSTTMLKSSLSLYLKAKLTKHLCMHGGEVVFSRGFQGNIHQQ